MQCIKIKKLKIFQSNENNPVLKLSGNNLCEFLSLPDDSKSRPHTMGENVFLLLRNIISNIEYISCGENQTK